MNTDIFIDALKLYNGTFDSLCDVHGKLSENGIDDDVADAFTNGFRFGLDRDLSGKIREDGKDKAMEFLDRQETAFDMLIALHRLSVMVDTIKFDMKLKKDAISPEYIEKIICKLKEEQTA